VAPRAGGANPAKPSSAPPVRVTGLRSDRTSRSIPRRRTGRSCCGRISRLLEGQATPSGLQVWWSAGIRHRDFECCLVRTEMETLAGGLMGTFQRPTPRGREPTEVWALRLESDFLASSRFGRPIDASSARCVGTLQCDSRFCCRFPAVDAVTAENASSSLPASRNITDVTVVWLRRFSCPSALQGPSGAFAAI
jgi:hypothetical protein